MLVYSISYKLLFQIRKNGMQTWKITDFYIPLWTSICWDIFNSISSIEFLSFARKDVIKSYYLYIDKIIFIKSEYKYLIKLL